jgi:hypothetical protein
MAGMYVIAVAGPSGDRTGFGGSQINSQEFSPISNFLPEFAALLPDSYNLLLSANLVVHPRVSRIVLHGSRGLAGGYRPNSDFDLSLIVDVPEDHIDEALFQHITRTTLDHWQAPIEVDLAVIYDQKKCGLKCFAQSTWQPEFCQPGGVDCFGLYKIQKGFHGLVTNAGIQVKLMYPCLKIWQREG